jgi:hypothetical protein
MKEGRKDGWLPSYRPRKADEGRKEKKEGREEGNEGRKEG